MTAPRHRSAAGALILALVGAVVTLTPTAVAAQVPDADSRSLTLDRVDVSPGDAVIVTMTGLQGESLTLSVCGNLAKRGSVDCANDSSVSDEIVRGGISYTQIVVEAPPAPCPCIVRALANDTRDFMVAPITILGHPVAEVVSPANEPLVEVVVDAEHAPEGLLGSLRSALGGRTRYRATVSVRNRTTEPLTKVVLSGSVGHWTDDDAADLDLEAPDVLEPGDTFTQDVVAEVSAPSVGGYAFEVIASGAGSTVVGTTTLTQHAMLLYVALVVLGLDLAWMCVRWIARRRPAPEVDQVDVIDLTRQPAEPMLV